MSTVDAREADEEFRGEVYLKIWRWDRKTGFWILNTRIDQPHGMKKVTGVAFSSSTDPSSSLLLTTTGEDGNIKIWRIRSVANRPGETRGKYRV